MKPGIILALILSLVLVGGAAWLRLSSSKNVQKNDLISLNNEPQEAPTYQELYGEFLSDKSTTASESERALTGTELVGRQIMIDYLALSGSGQATPANLQALAEKYVESIPTLHTSVTIGYQDIKTTKDSRESWAIYSSELSRIYSAHKDDFIETKVDVVKDNLDNNHYNLLSKAASSYELQARELKNIIVPLAFTSVHVRLVNVNLSLAAALNAASNTENDPASGFAGLIKIAPDMNEEQLVLSEISTILSKNAQ